MSSKMMMLSSEKSGAAPWIALSAKPTVSFEVLVTVNWRTTFRWLADTAGDAPTAATVTLILRSTVKLSEAVTCVCATPPTL